MRGKSLDTQKTDLILNKQQATSNKQQATSNISLLAAKFRFLTALAVIVFAAVSISCGGGGSGGGNGSNSSGSSINKYNSSSNTYHNGNGGSSAGNIEEIYINGNTTLAVSGYTFNGTNYSDVESLVRAIYANGITEDIFYVDFNVQGESSPRRARIRANGAANPGDDLTIDYQYKATYALPDSATEEVFYYKRDGIQLNLPPLSSSDYTLPDSNGIVYHANKYSVQGQVVSSGTVKINSSGDVALGTITPTGDTSYGFRSTDNTLVVNQTSGTLRIDNTGKNFTKVELPASAADGSISLDLSGVTGLNLAGDDGGAVGAGSPAITNGSKLGSVTLPDTGFSLGFGAFKDCNKLTSIDLSHCTSLGIWAFYGCSGLTSVDLTNITSIEQYAFENCSGLTGNINLSSCSSLDIGVFKDCSGITSVTLPASITSLGNYTFTGCSSLASIDLSNCTTIGEAAFYNCNSLTGNVNLSVCTSIGDYAFSECTGITGVTFGNAISSIGDGAFYNVNASFDFSTKDPHLLSYVSGMTFKDNVLATWDESGTPWISNWSISSGGWIP